jgi:WD40 repeat protein
MSPPSRLALRLAMVGCSLLACLVTVPVPSSLPLRTGPAGAARAVEEPLTDAYGDPLPRGARARLGTERVLHSKGWGSQVAFSPDGKTFASAQGHDVFVWDRRTGARVGAFKMNGLRVKTVGFGAEGRLLALGPEGPPESQGSVFSLWDVRTGKRLRRLERFADSEWSAACAISPDGRTVASAGKEIRLWDIASGEMTRAMPGHTTSGARACAFSPDGKSLASVGDAYQEPVIVRDLVTGEERLRLPSESGNVNCLAFSPNGKTLAFGEEDYAIDFRDAVTGRSRRRLVLGTRARSLAFSPDGSTLAAGDLYGAVLLLDAATGKDIRPIPVHWLTIRSVSFVADGKTVVTTGGDRTIRFWDAATGRQRRVLGPPDGLGAFHAVSRDGRHLASLDMDGRLLLRNTESGETRWQADVIPCQETAELAFAPDGRTLAVLAEPGRGLKSTLELWDVAGGHRLGPSRELALSYFRPIVFSPDGSLLAVAEEYHVVRIYRAGTRDALEPLTPEPIPCGRARGLAFSPDGHLLAVARDDRPVGLWEIASGREVGRFEEDGLRDRPCGWSVAFSPDGRTVATGDGLSIRFWSVFTGRPVGRLGQSDEPVDTRLREDGEPYLLDFSPDGKSIVSAGWTAYVALVWDVSTIRPEPPGGRRLTAQELAVLWDTLAADEGPNPHAAIGRLVAAPGDTVPFLRAHLRPKAQPDAARLRQLVADLDDEEFPVRERATRELHDAGEFAVPALEQALLADPSPEARRRAEDLLGELRAAEGRAPPAVLREVRAVRVLGYIGDADARRLLDELSRGAPEARLTREAQAAFRRLGNPVP